MTNDAALIMRNLCLHCSSSKSASARLHEKKVFYNNNTELAWDKITFFPNN